VIPTLGSPTSGATSEEIIASTDEGIYVNFGGLSPDMVTGEISASVDLGFKIEGGKLAYPLKNTMLGVNVFDLIGALDAVSSDCRREPGMVMPTMRFGGVRVASKGSS
jgi:predicted Zn-dependent protease